MGGLALSRVGGFVVAGLITIDMLPYFTPVIGIQTVESVFLPVE